MKENIHITVYISIAKHLTPRSAEHTTVQKTESLLLFMS